MINRELEYSEIPHINQQALPMRAVGSPSGAGLSRKEKRAIKKEQRSEKKALKDARKNGTLIGGEYIAPVAPREELFMGHPTINEIQKPGMATGLGIPENSCTYGCSQGACSHIGQSTGFGHQQTYISQPTTYTTGSTYTTDSCCNTGSTYTTGSHIGTAGSPRVIYESSIPTTTQYATTTQHIGGQPLMH